MSTHKIHDAKHAVFFITFTCFKWLPLIDSATAYGAFDKWFEYLYSQKANVLGYVIMPNHFHGLIFIDEKSEKNLNQLVASGKRFLAYDIVNGLKEHDNDRLLKELSQAVGTKEMAKGKKHQVFIPSFDAKECFSREMLETKLEYIHHNPVSGIWNLANDWVEYPYSSAAFYELNRVNARLTHYMDII